MNAPRLSRWTRVLSVLAVASLLGVAQDPWPAAAQEPNPFDPAAFAIGLELVADGLDQPVHVADPGDGSGRLFVVEQPGRIRIVRDGAVVAEPFLDIVDLVESEGSEQGLLSVAFDPDFPENGSFYVGYTARSGEGAGDNTVARYRVAADDPDRADPDSGEVLLAVADPFRNHNGGLVLFGPDGYLYVGMGDGGSRGDPEGNGQNPHTLLGNILRLDVRGEGGEEPYAIPPDNPFVDGEGGRPEIWAYGLRNPWRFSFDRATGDLYIADVGQGRGRRSTSSRPPATAARTTAGTSWKGRPATRSTRARHGVDAASGRVRDGRVRLRRDRRVRLPRRSGPGAGRRLPLRRLLLRTRLGSGARRERAVGPVGTGRDGAEHQLLRRGCRRRALRHGPQWWPLSRDGRGIGRTGNHISTTR